jgi:hypothetical protein
VFLEIEQFELGNVLPVGPGGGAATVAAPARVMGELRQGGVHFFIELFYRNVKPPHQVCFNEKASTEGLILLFSSTSAVNSIALERFCIAPYDFNGELPGPF